MASVRWLPCVLFKANRDWLADGTGREQLMKALRRSRSIISQVIVFREPSLQSHLFWLDALAIIMRCIVPAKWVRRKVAQNDVFSLATRRVYMSLFSSGFHAVLKPTISSKPTRSHLCKL